MKKFSKTMLLLTSIFTIGTAVGSGTTSAQASSNGIDTTVINEKWGKPTFVYGGGLSETQIEETIKLLKIENTDNVNIIAVTGEDLRHYLNDGAANTADMISSVLVQKQDSGNGVEVVIQTPNNITQITSDQYTNAAITAGVSDAKIIVASVSRVTGESALTGIYKAFDVNGEELEQDRMEVAQEELETTNQIAQENADEEGFDSSKLDQAMIEIKQSLAELKERQGELATREDIEQIINDALERAQLGDYVTQEQFNRLLDLFEKYQQTSAIDSEQVKEQLSDLANNVKDKVSDLINQAEESGLMDKIANFFREIWQAITALFN
ncbi:DUF1002 domain-containing protein [Jeotgalibaca ciconiae]|uniref:DUF1002 domain-containing protein n=1 Tax=Jeotgalibaca ciconiae TaxID=2496265 RepID=A0A3S9H7H0_9LACT|nr:DUF1002 domain-containing protein [Jeotgalibaca ciconiae]AZP03296.1 DUF1002 domain-containing protein [Jeotgalibaca ciconiae]HJB23367.1 DUF1002 domain-containing protein [Candidatus Jeotgalibaca pullicola]